MVFGVLMCCGAFWRVPCHYSDGRYSDWAFRRHRPTQRQRTMLLKAICPSVRPSACPFVTLVFFETAKQSFHRRMSTVKHTIFPTEQYGYIQTGVESNGVYETRSSAVAERPRDASCHWRFREVIQGHLVMPSARLIVNTTTLCWYRCVAKAINSWWRKLFWLLPNL